MLYEVITNGNLSFLLKQSVSVLGAAAYAFLFTYVMLAVINKVTPVKVTEEQETEGLDMSLHGEQAYVDQDAAKAA